MTEPIVIMPVWITDQETLELTEAAVESIKYGCPECTLVIVDNGSTLGGARLRDLADIYLRNKTNLGYAKAVNQGLKLAGEDAVVAVANNDIRVTSNWWQIAKKILTVYPEVGSIHYRMIGYNDPFDYGEEYWVDGYERWCSSSFFVVRVKQLYDENYLNSLDDWDYWRAFRELGLKTAYTNAAQYQHKDSHTQQKITTRSENDARNREYYLKKWGEEPETWLERLYPEQVKKDWKPFP